MFWCWSSRMKGTTFLLVFGILLSFCQAQVYTSPPLTSHKSGFITNLPVLIRTPCSSQRQRPRRLGRRRNMSSFSPRHRPRWAPPPPTLGTTFSAFWPARKLETTFSWPPSASLQCWRSSQWVTTQIQKEWNPQMFRLKHTIYQNLTRGFFPATQEDLSMLRVCCSEPWGTTPCRTLSSTIPWKTSWPQSGRPAKAWAPLLASTCHDVSPRWSVTGPSDKSLIAEMMQHCWHSQHGRRTDGRTCLQVCNWSRNSCGLLKSNMA